MTQPNADGRPGIAAAVVVSGGRVLLVRRRVREGQLSWQFPAGEVEPGETREEAAVRETREETGLSVTVVQALGERVHPATGRLMSYTACAVVGGYVSRSKRLPALDGAYLFSDDCDGTVRTLTPRAGGGVTMADTGLDASAVSSFGRSNGGDLYVLSLADGVFRLDPS